MFTELKSMVAWCITLDDVSGNGVAVQSNLLLGFAWQGYGLPVCVQPVVFTV